MNRETRTLEIRGRRFDLGPRAWLMGVLNITPDSFSDGGLYIDPGRAVDRGLALVAEGADVVDVGGESTRPGSLPVPEAEEHRRVVPVVESLRRQTTARISVDTAPIRFEEKVLSESFTATARCSASSARRITSSESLRVFE